MRFSLKDLEKEFEKTEDDIKAIQSVGQIIAEVLKQLDDERCMWHCLHLSKVQMYSYTPSYRQSLVWTTLCRILPTSTARVEAEGRNSRQSRYDHAYNHADTSPRSRPHGLQDELGRSGGCVVRGYWRLGRASQRTARSMSHLFCSCCLIASDSVTCQVIELPLLNPELFQRVGIKPPKGVLLYGPPGTGKTLLARAVAATLNTNFLKVVASAIVDKYIGESARVVREMFGYAKEHEPCVIFMDEIDAIGGRRFSEGTSADREIQRTLMEVGGAVSVPSHAVVCS